MLVGKWKASKFTPQALDIFELDDVREGKKGKKGKETGDSCK